MGRDWISQLREFKSRLEGGARRPTKRTSKSEGAPDRASTSAQTVRPRPPEPPPLPSVVPDEGLPPEPLAGAGQTFNIGVDVGTSTTKVCVRPPGAGSSVYVLALGPSEASTALCPSLVALDQGRLYFGHEAEQRAQHQQVKLFPHLKMCVACESSGPPQVRSTTCASVRSQADVDCSATFAMRNTNELLWASDLLTLFLAWAMGESRRRIPRKLSGETVPRTTYSVSAPIDQIDTDSTLAEVFGSIVFWAWRLSGAVTQGLSMTDAISWLDELRHVEVPPSAERLVELCSESSANVAGYFLSPEAPLGQYGIVDIGAWTTEISFFRLTDVARQHTGKLTLAFHAARSHRVAGGEVDERCCCNVTLLYSEANPSGGVTADAVRGQRESGTFGRSPLPLQAYGDPVVPCRSAVDFARDVVAQELRACFHETLGEAYEKEKQESAWHGQVRVLLAGGGSLDEVLCGGAQHKNFVAEVAVVPTPKDLKDLPSSDDYRRFLVAYGLASGSARWPKELLPSATLPIKPRHRARPTSEELGYSGH